MAVLRLSDGSIWVHSPVNLDDDLAAALAELGEVKHIVTPNYEHTKICTAGATRGPCALLPMLTPAGSNSASGGLLKCALVITTTSRAALMTLQKHIAGSSPCTTPRNLREARSATQALSDDTLPCM